MSKFENLVVSALKEDVDTKNNDFEPASPAEFKKSLSSSKHKQMLTDYSEHDLSKMKLFKVRGKNIGFALKKPEGETEHNELVAVHNNEPGVSGVGDHLMHAAIRHGAGQLDHFDIHPLTDLYERDVVYRKRSAGLREEAQSLFGSMISPV